MIGVEELVQIKILSWYLFLACLVQIQHPMKACVTCLHTSNWAIWIVGRTLIVEVSSPKSSKLSNQSEAIRGMRALTDLSYHWLLMLPFHDKTTRGLLKLTSTGSHQTSWLIVTGFLKNVFTLSCLVYLSESVWVTAWFITRLEKQSLRQAIVIGQYCFPCCGWSCCCFISLWDRLCGEGSAVRSVRWSPWNSIDPSEISSKE